VSVGADGSLRAFDLRTLEHSTILYESAADTPLARISFSNREQYVLLLSFFLVFLFPFNPLLRDTLFARAHADIQTHAGVFWNG
jgi:hypothetical protein